ncbi:hypothetical protein D3C86_1998670 [compost metagenome]
MVLAYSTCFGVRLPSLFSLSSLARILRLLRGVRSSCDMLARKSDLYFEMRASCSARSSRETEASSTSLFLAWSRLAFSASSLA